jgi:hypothetical protein
MFLLLIEEEEKELTFLLAKNPTSGQTSTYLHCEFLAPQADTISKFDIVAHDLSTVSVVLSFQYFVIHLALIFFLVFSFSTRFL